MTGEVADPVPCPASRRLGRGDGLQHAQPSAATATLCGIPASETELLRHLFRGRGGDDCPVCRQRVRVLPAP